VRRFVDYPRRGKRGFRKYLPSWRLVLAANGLGLAFLFLAFAYLYYSVTIPDPNKLATANTSVVYWNDGKTEMGRFNVDDGNRRSIAFDKMPESLKKSVLAAEDRSFYSNNGFSPSGIGRAVWTKLKGGSTQGGSTITQQYVKNYFLTQDRTASRKVKELVIALKVEREFSKDVILQNYLNSIYFGRQAYGVETASQAYFGVSASQLTLTQSALLAAVIRSPLYYDPITHKPEATARWNYVLDGLVSQGWLAPDIRARQKFPVVKAYVVKNRFSGTNGYLLSAVHNEVGQKTGLSDTEIDRGGLRIVTTFDPKAQAAAVAAMKAKMPTENTTGVRVGLVSVKPGDGAIVAMYGGPDALKEPLNAATAARMQAGSTFKIFGLIAALQNGKSLRSTYNAHTPGLIDGVTVKNAGGEQFGTVDLVQATAHSINVAFVKMNAEIGPQKARQAAIDAGYPTTTANLKDNLVNVLGTASPTIRDVAGAYSTIAAQGMRTETYMVAAVSTSDGSVSFRATPKPKRVFAADVMADVTFALQDVTKEGTAKYVNSNLGRPAAGKTGTTTDSKAAWFAGFTPQLTTVVGMYRGGKDGAELPLDGLGGKSVVAGSTFAVPIWTAYMKSVLAGKPEVAFPQPAYVGTTRPSDRVTTQSTPTATATVPATVTATTPTTTTTTAPATPSSSPTGPTGRPTQPGTTGDPTSPKPTTSPTKTGPSNTPRPTKSGPTSTRQPAAAGPGRAP
jgi:membrane peptidoglycan carboxypeptidase